MMTFWYLDNLSSPSIFNSADEWSQIAYVTFKDSQGAETALLLSVNFLKIFIFFLEIVTAFSVNSYQIICILDPYHT